MKRWLFLAHRWLGVFGCLLVLLWFLSGFVMMYVPFPALDDGERLAALPSLTAPALTPQAVVAQAVRAGAPQEALLALRLLQPAERPVYALHLAGTGWHGIDGHTGVPLQIDTAAAQRAAERFAGVPARQVERIERDQWSVSSSLDAHRPLFAVHMADGGLHYVSSRTGEVVRDTARAERAWNWVGAVVHWVYPTVLRSRPTVWHWTVVLLAGYCLAVAGLGTVLGVLRWRRYASGRWSPYRGWMRWHHLLGLAGALFVLAWLLSGLLSMNPGGVFSPHHPSAAQVQRWGSSTWQPQPAPVPALGNVKEVQWWRDPGGTLTQLRTSATTSRLLRGHSEVFVDEPFLRLRGAAMGLGAVQHIERLDARDLHYHARNAARPLPVWRLRFADVADTWVHVDSRSGQPFSRIDSGNRSARWLYHGLHSWDFEPLLQRRPLWDVLLLAAMALGAALSFTNVVIALRRLRTRLARRGHPIARPLHRPSQEPA